MAVHFCKRPIQHGNAEILFSIQKLRCKLILTELNIEICFPHFSTEIVYKWYPSVKE